MKQGHFAKWNKAGRERLILHEKKWKLLSHVQLFPTQWAIACQVLCPWNFPGQNTGVGSLSLLQGIFSILGSNPGLPHCRQILYQLSHQRSPRILGWVAYPFSKRSFWPRIQTVVSCIAGRFFTGWATGDSITYMWTLKGKSQSHRNRVEWR